MQFTCQACGANCSITIPIVKKTVTFATPPCPIKAAHLAKTIPVTLPSKSPIPLKSKVAGTVTLDGPSDKNGDLIKVEFTAQIAPNAENLADAVYDVVRKMNA